MFGKILKSVAKAGLKAVAKKITGGGKKAEQAESTVERLSFAGGKDPSGKTSLMSSASERVLSSPIQKASTVGTMNKPKEDTQEETNPAYKWAGDYSRIMNYHVK